MESQDVLVAFQIMFVIFFLSNTNSAKRQSSLALLCFAAITATRSAT